jgi:putative spermidine/putrescine transport system ATP-binding protein
MGTSIGVRDVHKTYGSFVALDRVSIDIEAGEFLTLLGPSGSGKTTLLNVLAGFVRPDHGSVIVDGEEFLTKPPHRRNLGMVFQNYALFPHMNVHDNVAYPLKLRGESRERIANRVAEALEIVRLGDLGGRAIDQLSGGQRQRVALARALVFEPKILLMDEPLSALDKQLREHMQIEVRRLHRQLGTTTIYVTHDQKEALTMSDRVAVINKGRIAQLDTPARIYERPASKFVADFIGETSFIPVVREGAQATALGRPLRMRDGLPADGAAGWMAIRPEAPVLLDAPDDAYNCFAGTVRDSVYQGGSFLLYVELAGGHEVMLRQSAQVATRARVPASGQQLVLGIHPDDTVVVAER